MAIVKITELPAATSPVNPSEVAAVVQGGVTKKAAIDEFGFAPAGQNAVIRTIQDKLREVVSVKDYGAVGDGVTDDRAAINAAFRVITDRGAGTVYFPAGTYRVTNFIGFATAPSQATKIAVEGEPGTTIVSDPSGFTNDVLFLRNDAHLQTAIVKNITVNCSNKTARGINVQGNNLDLCVVDNCQVSNVFGAQASSGVTAAVNSIRCVSDLGTICSITNSSVENVTREAGMTSPACAGIVAIGFQTTLIENNSVVNVQHDGTLLADADSIVVFSDQNVSSQFYRPSVAKISNNHLVDTDGRFIKLQTHGSALVEGNTMTLSHSRALIDGFVAVDCQVAQATITNNKIVGGANWTGGTSASVCKLTPPLASGVVSAFEQFVQKFNNNEVYLRKPMPYGVTPLFPVNGVEATVFLEICDNIYSYPAAAESTSGTVWAVNNFIYVNNAPAPADFTARSVWTVARNKVYSINFITLDFTQADYTDKWWFYIYDNFKYGVQNWVIRRASGAGGVPGNSIPYTSTMLLGDNQIGINATNSKQYNAYAGPLNSVKLINGSDFSTGDSSAGTISPAPATWRDGRFYKRGGVMGVETVSGGAALHYISTDNGANWYQV